MSVSDLQGLAPHDIARAQIEAWRGRCLNLFARGEQAVLDSLLLASTKLPELRIEPLAGQRLNALEQLVAAHDATDAQRAAIKGALFNWKNCDAKRAYFAHGVFTELFDNSGNWFVRMDFDAVQKGECKPRRMVLSQQEAEDFEASLRVAFRSLATQLGQFRKGLQG